MCNIFQFIRNNTHSSYFETGRNTSTSSEYVWSKALEFSINFTYNNKIRLLDKINSSDYGEYLKVSLFLLIALTHTHQSLRRRADDDWLALLFMYTATNEEIASSCTQPTHQVSCTDHRALWEDNVNALQSSRSCSFTCPWP